MDILMLGDSSVGKTTFMVATYGLMSEGGIEGFSVKCSHPQMHKNLISAFKDLRSDNRYPAPTIKMDSYEYSFYCRNEWIMDFVLTDMRGESIRDYDMTDLANAIKKSNVILLFLNGYEIIRGEDVEDSLFDVFAALNTNIDVSQEMLLMPIFTQMDRCGNLTDGWYERLQNSVRQLLDMAEKNDKITVQPVPIACACDCMMDLDFVMVSMMMFGYRLEFQGYMDGLVQEKASIEQQYGEGLLRAIVDILGLDFERDKARRRWNELQKKIPLLQQMQEKYNELVKFYDDYKIGTSYKLKPIFTTKYDDIYNLQ